MQCGPSGQLAGDFVKMQGMAPMGNMPMGGGGDNDGDMMAMMDPSHAMMMGGGMGGDAQMNAMMSNFGHMAIASPAGPMAMASPAAVATAASASAAAGPMLAPDMMMGAPMMMMNPMMMGMGPMMMGGGPQLMYPHQLQMQQQQMAMMQQQAMASMPQQQQMPQLPQQQQQPIMSVEAMMAQPLDEGQWLNQFKTETSAKSAEDQKGGVQTFGHEGETVRTLDDKTADSGFYNFMDKVNSGKIAIDEENNEVREVQRPVGEAVDGSAEWAAQLATAQSQVDAAYSEQMMNHVPDPTTESWRMREGEGGDAVDMLEGMQDDYNGEGGDEEFFDPHADGEAWAAEYKEMMGRFADAQNATDYPFEKENAFMFNDDPFSEGKELLAMGVLSDAVLAFEAACQKTPDHQEAWKLLGTTQAENEKDMLAIRALNKAKQLNPRDKEVYMALSVSHANESNHAFALEALKGWLLCQPEYEMLVDVLAGQQDTAAAEVVEGGEDGDDYAEFMGMMSSPKEKRDLVTLFTAAIEMNGTADASLHVGLGIAHHLSQSYGEAAECFRAALAVDPNDAKVWNKLGATLANSSKSEEAVQMYENALNINPGYVRARYNLGIAHNNMGRHEVAAQHFARAIVMQQGGSGNGEGGNGHVSRSTREMWDALRMALNFTNRPDLVEHTWKQDIMPILAEYGLSDLAF